MPAAIALSRPHVGNDEIAAAVRVLRSGQLVQGQEVAAFEAEFSRIVAGRHCVAVSSGTAALHLTLTGLGIGVGDEVVLPSFTFAATANAVALTGAAPVFADIDPHTFCLAPAAAAAAITPRTAAIVAVHLYGHPAAMHQLDLLADRHGLALVEDAAQAVAAHLHHVPAGALGHAAAFSFYPTKNMHTMEGGMITTADTQLARRLRLLRNQGMDRPYHHEIIGFNARMTELAAAIGRVQLAALPRRTAARQSNAAYLDTHLRTVTIPRTGPGVGHVYHQYTVRTDQRDMLRDRLAAAGIGTGVYYPVPVHRQPAHGQAHPAPQLPHTDVAVDQVLSLPVHPDLSTADLARIVEAVNP